MLTSPLTDTSLPTPRTGDPAPQAAQAGETLSSDFDTFLQLLTAQIRHQDPLEPVDNTEFVAQLATFSNVEQSIRSNEILEGIVARMDGQDMAAAGSWIGMEVRHAGPITADHATVLHADIPPVADRADMVALDAKGDEVFRRAVDPDRSTFDWPYANVRLPAGRYAVHVEAFAGDQPLTPIPTSHYATVNEVALGEDGTDLVLETGVRVSPASLDSVRRGDG